MAQSVVLREQGEGGPVGEVMRASEPLLPGQPLMEAFTRMRGRGANAEVVMDAGGRVDPCGADPIASRRHRPE